MQAALKNVRQRRAEVELAGAPAFVPLLLNERDVGALATALGQFLRDKDDPEFLERNIEKFFKLRRPQHESPKTEKYPNGRYPRYLDIFGFHFRQNAYRRALENGYGEPAKGGTGGQFGNYVEATIGGAEIKITASDIGKMLAAISCMTESEETPTVGG